jgi:hypothetical protein
MVQGFFILKKATLHNLYRDIESEYFILFVKIKQQFQLEWLG